MASEQPSNVGRRRMLPKHVYQRLESIAFAGIFLLGVPAFLAIAAILLVRDVWLIPVELPVVALLAVATGLWWQYWLRPARPLDESELEELDGLAAANEDIRRHLAACVDHHGLYDRKDLDDARMMMALRCSAGYDMAARASGRKTRAPGANRTG